MPIPLLFGGLVAALLTQSWVPLLAAAAVAVLLLAAVVGAAARGGRAA